MKEKKVFISHHGKDDEHIGKLKDLLGDKGYTLKNSSIDSTKPNDAKNTDYIKSMLRPRINWAGAMIVLIGPGTAKRDFVNWEIEQAAKADKNIFGVYIRGGTDSDIPPALNKYGCGAFGWMSDKIIDALNGKSPGWEKADGSPRDSYYKASGVDC
ncbi:TIR domain-containing protein [Pseudodesulfovibrio methanolicus]|uniref:TIR domain-containing protein n=1 Tax=Pseudodesulfovibrio methanolicus TaxID=3126690 RepID=A0ABZ2ISS2_9BACT